MTFSTAYHSVGDSNHVRQNWNLDGEYKKVIYILDIFLSVISHCLL